MYDLFCMNAAPTMERVNRSFSTLPPLLSFFFRITEVKDKTRKVSFLRIETTNRHCFIQCQWSLKNLSNV